MSIISANKLNRLWVNGIKPIITRVTNLETKTNGLQQSVSSIPRVTVENSLTSTSTTNALSSAQGKALNDAKAPKASPVFTGSISLGRKSGSTAGSYSYAVGYDVQATDMTAHAEGYGTEASGQCAHAEGYKTVASESTSHSEGNISTAYGDGAHAEGYSTIAYGEYTHAEGYQTQAQGSYSHAEGQETVANAVAGHAEGYQTTAEKFYSHAEGRGTQAGGNMSHAEGYLTVASGENSHAEGYQTTASGADSHSEGHSAVAKGAYSHAEGYNTTADATYSHAEGYNTTAAATYSHAEGCNTTMLSTANYSHVEGYGARSSGICAHAEGYSTHALGNYSHAKGRSTVAQGENSYVEGYTTNATGAFSHAEGYSSAAVADYSHAQGVAVKASNYASCAMGKMNKDMSGGGLLSTQVGDAFVIGNGTSDSSRSNALRVTYGGAVYGVGNFNASGADYAEFIKPWADGNPDEEDRVGYFVTVRDGKLYKAQGGDYIVGITSGNPSVVGNADEDYYWKYERDEFNRIVMEDVPEVVHEKDKEGNLVFDEETHEPVMVETGNIIKNARMKLAKDYDPSLQDGYIERKDRKEWDYVGMVGVLPLRDDGTCIVGKYCKCGQDGVATLASERGFDTCFVLERVTENIVTVILK